MKQFYCKKCKRTWKTEEGIPNITYSDGICGDCSKKQEQEKLPDKLIKTVIKKGELLPNPNRFRVRQNETSQDLG